MENLFVDRNIDNERGPVIVDDLKRRILVYKFFVFSSQGENMKIHLKDNKIALYDIESDYRQYLFQYDFRVNLKPNR